MPLLADEPKKSEKKPEVTQEKKAEKDRVVVIKERNLDEVLAKYPGGDVKRKDILPYLEGIGMAPENPQPEKVANAIETQVAAYVAFLKHVLPLAEKEGIAKTKAFQIQQAKERILIAAYLAMMAEKGVTDDQIRTEYEKRISEMKNEKIVEHARIIVDKESDATNIINKTKGATLEKRHDTFYDFIKQYGPERAAPKRETSTAELKMTIGADHSAAIAKLPAGSVYPKAINLGGKFVVFFIEGVKAFDAGNFKYDMVKAQVAPTIKAGLVRSKEQEVIKTMLADKGFQIKDDKGEFKGFAEKGTAPSALMNK